MIRHTGAGLLALCLALCLSACGDSREAPDMALAPATPPPMPEGAESVEFETEAAPEPDPAPAASEDNGGASEVHPKYWGIAAGEPLPLRWEDLMPEGSEEELYRQQEEFYRMLQQRYAANSSSLADAQPFDEIEEGSAMDFMPQFGTFDVVEDLDGELIRIPGYVVPFDFTPNRRLNEFLFVPYMGACIHTPPPPPNQIIFVRADPAVKVDDIWAPYWLEGELSAEVNENEVGDAAYALSLTEMEPYPVP